MVLDYNWYLIFSSKVRFPNLQATIASGFLNVTCKVTLSCKSFVLHYHILAAVSVASTAVFWIPMFWAMLLLICMNHGKWYWYWPQHLCPCMGTLLTWASVWLFKKERTRIDYRPLFNCTFLFKMRLKFKLWIWNIWLIE